MHASKATTQHNTKQYINCTIRVANVAHKLAYLKLSQQQNTLPLLHLAISGALSGNETVHSASFTAFKKNIYDMVDFLKQLWFVLTIELYKLWHKGTTSG